MVAHMRILLSDIGGLLETFAKKFVRKSPNLTPNIAKRALKAIYAYKADLESDRVKHFQLFMGAWRYAAANVDHFANEALMHPLIDGRDVFLDAFMRPYDLQTNYLSSALIGTFDYAEECEFVKTAEILTGAWRKLFGVFRLRARTPEATIATAETAVNYLQTRMVGVYRGSEKPVIDTEWTLYFDAARDSLKTILEDLAK